MIADVMNKAVATELLEDVEVLREALVDIAATLEGTDAATEAGGPLTRIAGSLTRIREQALILRDVHTEVELLGG